MFVFLFVVELHIPDNDRSQLLPQDTKLNLINDFSLSCFFNDFQIKLKKKRF